METSTDIRGEDSKVPQGSTTPKDVFLYLLMIVTLIMSVVSFITLIFQYVNLLFPDPLAYDSPYDSIRWATAMLIVAFPVFIWISYLIEKELKANPAKKDIGVRKWLIYLALFVSAITIIIDLITLVFYFYSGDLTNRFLLKVCVVLITAAAVFAFYRWELQREDIRSDVPKLWGWIVSAIVIGSIVAGFFIAGSPADQRKVRLDSERITHIRDIQYAIAIHWEQNEELPEDLDELMMAVLPTDPETGEAYEYNVTGERSFEICAEFDTVSSDRLSREFYEPSFPNEPFLEKNEKMEHTEGRNCFEKTIDPEAIISQPIR